MCIVSESTVYTRGLLSVPVISIISNPDAKVWNAVFVSFTILTLFKCLLGKKKKSKPRSLSVLHIDSTMILLKHFNRETVESASYLYKKGILFLLLDTPATFVKNDW